MIFGWDISTSVIGASLFTNDCKYACSYHIDLTKIDSGLIDKSFAAEEWIMQLMDKHFADLSGRNYHFIEDKLGGFSGGRTMQQVLLKLAAFNSTVTFIICKCFRSCALESDFEHIHPSTVKSIMKREGLIIPKGQDKKKLTLAFVAQKESSFTVDKNRNENPQPWCYDRADSYIVARAGFLRKCVVDAQGKKVLPTQDES